MANINISGGVSINLLVNGDNLNTTLNSTKPLYQTFKKGTTNFAPDWATMPSGEQPVVYPRIYSVMEAKELKSVNGSIEWKYNNQVIQFGANDEATFPDAITGKVKQIDYNGSKALKMIGNIASESNNDSDMFTFTGKVEASGQEVEVSSEIPLIIEEASGNLYRLFLNTDDDVLDGDETSLTIKASLFSSGSKADSNKTKFEFQDISGIVLQSKRSDDTLILNKSDIDSELLVVCIAYFNDKEVAREQRQVWDATDPFTIVCNRGTSVRQRSIDDFTYAFSVLNARTGSVMPSATFTITVYKNSDSSVIRTVSTSDIEITGVEINTHKSIYLDANAKINQ